MAYEKQDHCEGCGIAIPHVEEGADPAARLCDECFKKTEAKMPEEKLTIKEMVNRVTGELIIKPEYKYVDPRIVADVVKDAINRAYELKLWEE